MEAEDNGLTTREQRNAERRQRILEAARVRADADGWASVTTRRLAEAIGYTQPVLYGHFPAGKSEIMTAVALEGFGDLGRRCRDALDRADDQGTVEAVAVAYLDFCRAHPAVYEAMFGQDIATAFASEDTPPAVRAGFAALAETVGDPEGGALTEVFWGALHGIGQLESTGRMPPASRDARVAALASRFATTPE